MSVDSREFPSSCEQPGCDEAHVAQGRCRNHYAAWRASDDFKPSMRWTTEHRILDADEDALTGTCLQCGPVEIRMRPYKPGARRPVCRIAIMTAARKRREQVRKSPELRVKRNAYHARYARAVKYGLTTAALDEILAGDLACEICGDGLTPATARFDHDHSCCASTVLRGCGECFRGILCNRCNTALGFFQDSPELFRSAIAYLTKPA